jgi:hypothetical protein
MGQIRHYLPRFVLNALGKCEQAFCIHVVNKFSHSRRFACADKRVQDAVPGPHDDNALAALLNDEPPVVGNEQRVDDVSLHGVAHNGLHSIHIPEFACL